MESKYALFCHGMNGYPSRMDMDMDMGGRGGLLIIIILGLLWDGVLSDLDLWWLID